MRSMLRRTAATALLALAATAIPAVASAPRYSGPLGAALHASGLEDVQGLTLHQAPLGAVPAELGSLYEVAGSATTLAVLRLPSEVTAVYRQSVWIRMAPRTRPAGWLVEQTADDGTAKATALDPGSVSPAIRGIGGCDVAGEILGIIFKSIPGIGLAFEAACTAPGPTGGVRWSNYDPIFPQSPANYYDKGWQWNPHVGPDPVWQFYDVYYQSQRCLTQEQLFVQSQKPNNPYRGPSGACVSYSDSDLLFGHYVYVTAFYISDVVWIDGSRQSISFSTDQTFTWAPTVYHINAYVPTGEYTGTGTAKEYWPEFCGPTYNPTVEPRATYMCKTGQVRDHVQVFRTP